LFFIQYLLALHKSISSERPKPGNPGKNDEINLTGNRFCRGYRWRRIIQHPPVDVDEEFLPAPSLDPELQIGGVIAYSIAGIRHAGTYLNRKNILKILSETTNEFTTKDTKFTKIIEIK